MLLFVSFLSVCYEIVVLFKFVMFVHVDNRQAFIDRTYVYYFLLFTD